MRYRSRSLPGLLALLAMTLSIAEGVLAVTCRPESSSDASMSMSMDTSGGMRMDMAAPETVAISHGAMSDTHGASRDNSRMPGPSGCPFAPGSLAQGCAVVAMPAATVTTPSTHYSVQFAIPLSSAVPRP